MFPRNHRDVAGRPARRARHWLAGATILAAALSGTAAPAATKQRADLPPALTAGGDKAGGAPQSRTLYLKLIGDMRDTGKPHAALAHLDAFDRQYPHRPEATLLRGDCLVDIGDYAGATTAYRQLLHGGESAAAHAGLARIEALGGRWPGAAAEFASAVALEPVSVAYLNDYGFALVRAGRAADGLFRLRQAAELSPGNLKVRNNLIIALAATGNEAEAKQLLATVATPEERATIEAAMQATPPAARP